MEALQATVRRLSWVDIVLVSPMAVPGLAGLILSIAEAIDGMLGLASPLGDLSTMGMVFVHVVGILATVWSIARIKEPTLLLAKLDAWARLAVTAVLLFYMAMLGPSVLFFLFLASEIIGAALQFLAIRKAK